MIGISANHLSSYLFPAADTEQLEYIKKVIDECDYYILIMGGRYGSLDEEGVSFTEREYDYAVDTGKVVLAFPHGDLTSLPISKSDTGDRMQRNLTDFRTKVMTGRLVREWSTREQLESLVVKAIVRATADYPAVGWVRGDTAASETLLQQINDLRNDNESLKDKLNRALNANKPSLTNLAGFNDVVRLNFYRKPYRGGQQIREDKSFSFSWSMIFVAVAVNIGASKSTGLIGSFIDKYRKKPRQIRNYLYAY
ncbi:DUF4062 domain-containing protein [Novosphingobium jiangmenense]|uniref:DUF4062 domain-containing protein n=1 Tax=Novosphingobium jiangmenense TaxID=2791981 RepID=A0ABS0HKD0_9SPHN|nr:DUF4062 domain-containing protein [Novosphingobium jiangmenense]MBF9152710.1 DUF4062 domain-containing protein [Novosphingobium jiangmenense]